MNHLPIEIEGLIVDYKNQLEHFDKLSTCLKEMNKIRVYEYYNDKTSKVVWKNRDFTYEWDGVDMDIDGVTAGYHYWGFNDLEITYRGIFKRIRSHKSKVDIQEFSF